MFEGIALGFSAAFSWQAILFLIGGCLAGTLIGMLPGLGPMTAIALMIPIASTLEPTSGIIMMAAVYYGAIFRRFNVLYTHQRSGRGINCCLQL